MVTETEVVHQDLPEAYHIGVPVRTQSWELESSPAWTDLDPADLAWLVLTHPDADHVGALPELLAAAPKARLVANWVSTGKLSASMLPPKQYSMPIAAVSWVSVACRSTRSTPTPISRG